MLAAKRFFERNNLDLPLHLHCYGERMPVKDRRKQHLQSECRAAPASHRLILPANARFYS